MSKQLGLFFQAILFYLFVLFAIFPHYPTQLTGWLMVVFCSPLFLILFGKFFPGERNKNLTFREIIFILGLVGILIFILNFDEKCGNCISKYY